MTDKHLRVNESTWKAVNDLPGKSANEKITDMIIVYRNRQLSEPVLTKFLNRHMNEIKTILDKQDKIIFAQSKDIQEFIKEVRPLMKFIEKSTGGY